MMKIFFRSFFFLCNFFYSFPRKQKKATGPFLSPHSDPPPSTRRKRSAAEAALARASASSSSEEEEGGAVAVPLLEEEEEEEEAVAGFFLEDFVDSAARSTIPRNADPSLRSSTCGESYSFTSPLSRTRTLSAPAIECRRWAIVKTVDEANSGPRSTRPTAASAAPSTAAVASSSTSTLGLRSSARAMHRSCRWPEERFEPFFFPHAKEMCLDLLPFFFFLDLLLLLLLSRPSSSLHKRFTRQKKKQSRVITSTTLPFPSLTQEKARRGVFIMFSLFNFLH